MTTSPLAQEHIETSKDGRKIPGQSREMLIDPLDLREMNPLDLREMMPLDPREMIPLDPREITTGNQTEHKKEGAITPTDMTAGKGQEVQALEDTGEETTALDMIMITQGAGEEDNTALKIMAVEDTLAMADEKTAQGP